MMTTIGIQELHDDPSHFGSLDLLLTVKSFDLQSIRKRYLASKANASGRTGSVVRRKPGLGGLVGVKMEGDQLVSIETLWTTKEPRGIDWQPDALTLAAENTVYLIESSGNWSRLNHPWMSYIHTVAWSPFVPNTLLVSSSGLDILQLYADQHLTWEWLAWEHGFNTGYDTEKDGPILLTRQPDMAANWAQKGLHHLLMDQPDNAHLPTAMRAAFINSATFDPLDPSIILATFFHEGKVYAINQSTGEAKPVVDHLHHPHGGRRFGTSYMATSTASGEVVLQEGDRQTRYSTAALPGKPDYLAEKEWVQNTITTEEEWIIIDSNRTAFIRIDPRAGKYCIVPYPDHWAVQDGTPGKATTAQREQLPLLT